MGLAPGTGESTEAWADFLTDLRDRGLACPLLVVSDGARGLIAAIEQVFPAALRQRCLIHRVRNVLAKIPTGMHAEIRDGYWACFDTDERNTEPGPRLVELVDARLTAFADRYAPIYPAAMKILAADREGLTAYSARDPRTPIIIRPAGVEESIPSVTDTRVMSRSVRSFTVCRMWIMLRPSRSSFHTTTVSPARTYSSSAANPGRSSRAPEMVSEKILDTPAAAKAAFCCSNVCNTVLTRSTDRPARHHDRHHPSRHQHHHRRQSADRLPAEHVPCPR